MTDIDFKRDASTAAPLREMMHVHSDDAKAHCQNVFFTDENGERLTGRDLRSCDATARWRKHRCTDITGRRQPDLTPQGSVRECGHRCLLLCDDCVGRYLVDGLPRRAFGHLKFLHKLGWTFLIKEGIRDGVAAIEILAGSPDAGTSCAPPVQAEHRRYVLHDGRWQLDWAVVRGFGVEDDVDPDQPFGQHVLIDRGLFPRAEFKESQEESR